MEGLIASFVLGVASAASPCLLPLYPAFLGMLVSGRSGGGIDAVEGSSAAGAERSTVTAALYGLVVVMGVVTVLIVVGLIVTALSVSLTPLLGLLVPLTTVLLLVLGVLMLTGRNPFERLATVRMPLVRHPLGQAYVYGLFFGPVALPCSGPFVVALLAISIGVAETATRLLGFVAFGIGLGLPLIGLSLIGAVRARSVASWLARHHQSLTRAVGVLLIVAAFAEPVRIWLEAQ